MTNEPHPRRRVEPEPADRTGVDWEEMAAWWDERQGNEGDLWHRTLIDPTLFSVLGTVKGQHVLDLVVPFGNSLRLSSAHAAADEDGSGWPSASRERSRPRSWRVNFQLKGSATCS